VTEVFAHSQGIIHRDIKPENVYKQFKNQRKINIQIKKNKRRYSMAKSKQATGVPESSIDTYKQIMAVVVHASAVGLGEILKNYKSQAKKTELIRSFVNKTRFFPDQTGYFFVYDYDCLNIALPNPIEWQGKNLYDLKDSHGKYQIRELSAAAKQGGGFVEYYWLKPGSTVHQKKLSYAEPIPGTNYFLGTGVYTKN
jgi:hypothetical protein